MERNGTMAAVNSSAYRGMSGGPLCYEKDSVLHVAGIIVGSAASPMGKFVRHFLRNIVQGSLRKFLPIEENLDEMFSLKGSTEKKSIGSTCYPLADAVSMVA